MSPFSNMKINMLRKSQNKKPKRNKSNKKKASRKRSNSNLSTKRNRHTKRNQFKVSSKSSKRNRSTSRNQKGLIRSRRVNRSRSTSRNQKGLTRSRRVNRSKRVNRRNMKGGSCRLSMGQESGFNVSNTAFDGLSLNPVAGMKLPSSRFQLGRSCSNQTSGHAMVV